MDRFVCVTALIGLCLACGVAEERENIAISAEALVSTQGRESQGRESQGRESQGTDLNGNFDLKRYLLPTLRMPFANEPLSTVDEPRLVQGELQVLRSLPSGSTLSLKQCIGEQQPVGISRACGWASSGLGQCVPGSSVRLAAGALCSGTCTGNPMMRVCEGLRPCEPNTRLVLGANDDACGSPCPALTFACPASGLYNVMTAPSNTNVKTVASVRLVASTGTYPVFNVHHGGTELQGAFIDAEFTDSSRQTFQIAKVLPELEQHVPKVPSGVHGTTYRYQVQQPVSGGYADLCGADDDGAPVAIPVQGWWDKTGMVNFASDSFTFSCRRGVIAKCYRWGYRAWDAIYGNGLPGNPAYNMGQAHQACTRMARADYCGDGRSFTYNGTTINLWDIFKPQVQVRDPAASAELGLRFEAGWSERGAVCLSHARWDNAPPEVFDPVACPLLFGRGGVVNPRVCDTQQEAISFSMQEQRPSVLFEDSANNHYDGGL